MKQEHSISPLELMGIHHVTKSGTEESEPQFLIKTLKKGLPYKAYIDLGAERELGTESFLPILGISIATLKRRAKEKTFNPAESNRLYRFASLLADASNALGSKEKAILWFKSPNRALSGDTPIDRLVTEVGYQQVQDLINRIKYGIYS